MCSRVSTRLMYRLEKEWALLANLKSALIDFTPMRLGGSSFRRGGQGKGLLLALSRLSVRIVFFGIRG